MALVVYSLQLIVCNYFFANTMDWTGASGANFRIFSVPIKGNSYLAHQLPYVDPCLTLPQNNDDTVSLTDAQYRGLIAAVVLEGSALVVLLAIYFYRNRKISYKNEPLLEGSL